MTVRWLLAALHLLALGIGLGAVLDRAWSLRGRLDEAGLRRLFRADNLWALAALLWISTGLLRAFAGFEKGTAFYLASYTFWLKMGVLLIIFGLELAPMIGLVRWRARLRRGEPIDPARAATYARISVLQAGLVISMIFIATALARGIGA
jgi:putative membrane protein